MYISRDNYLPQKLNNYKNRFIKMKNQVGTVMQKVHKQ